jgi:hypothetical protein
VLWLRRAIRQHGVTAAAATLPQQLRRRSHRLCIDLVQLKQERSQNETIRQRSRRRRTAQRLQLELHVQAIISLYMLSVQKSLYMLLPPPRGPTDLPTCAPALPLALKSPQTRTTGQHVLGSGPVHHAVPSYECKAF